MIEVKRTGRFQRWLDRLKDRRARGVILERINRVAAGNFGHTRALGGGLSELKIDFGPGYRLYYTRRGDRLVWLLCGGDKSSQSADIALAHAIIARLTGDDDDV